MPEQRKFSNWNLSLRALIAIVLAIPAWYGADLGYLLVLGAMLCAIAFVATVLELHAPTTGSGPSPQRCG
jgi:hypothetical protein